MLETIAGDVSAADTPLGSFHGPPVLSPTASHAARNDAHLGNAGPYTLHPKPSLAHLERSQDLQEAGGVELLHGRNLGLALGLVRDLRRLLFGQDQGKG